MPSSGGEDWTDQFIRDLSEAEPEERGRASTRDDESKAERDDVLLGRLVVERGLLRPQELEACLRELQNDRARGLKISIKEILVQRHVLSPESLTLLLQDQRATIGDVPDIPRYEVRERLGEGTSAVVYRAWDREVKRFVALKVLRESAALNEIARQRFRREAQAAGAISHSNVILVHDAGEVMGRLYIVFELVEGRPLADSMRSGTPRDALLRILLQAARGVAAAHQKGIVHRDLKPANILLTPSGEAKVGDFGLAHVETSTLELTRAGSTLGTPLYMAPEQVQGNVQEISPRTDVYALGAILYEILAGRAPHTGETLAEVYEKILRKDPLPPSHSGRVVPGDLETVAMKALEKGPALRYPTAAEFSEDLRRALEGEPILARPVGALGHFLRRLKRSRRVFLPIAAAVLVGLGIGWVASRTRKSVVASVESVQGDVTLIGSAGRLIAQKDSSLSEGEGVETGQAPSRAVVRLPGGASFEAGPVSIFRVGAKGSFIIASGTISAEPAGRPFDLSTPQAQIHSEGGPFSVAVDANWTRVESKAGGVRVTHLHDGRSADLPAGTFVRVTSEGGSLSPVPLVDRVLRVGPGKPFPLPSGAAAAATDGAVVEIDAGLYEGDVAAWKASNLTIRGVGGRARIRGAGKTVMGRALWVLSGRNTLVENVEFSNAGPESSTAALWFESAGLTVRNCAFLDNSRALTGTDNPESDLLIEYSEFGRNGNRDATPSNLSCPVQRSAVIRHCYIHQAILGHQVSSNARSTYLLYCRVADEGTPSSMLLVASGSGSSYVIGNVLCRGGSGLVNQLSISFAQGSESPMGTLYFVNNTLVDEKASESFIGVGQGANARIMNNIFCGKVGILSGKGDVANNMLGRDPLFVDPASGDYRLQKGSPAIDAGVDPGSGGGFDLTPKFHYVHPAGKMLRLIHGTLDLGAFEFGP